MPNITQDNFKFSEGIQVTKNIRFFWAALGGTSMPGKIDEMPTSYHRIVWNTGGVGNRGILVAVEILNGRSPGHEEREEFREKMRRFNMAFELLQEDEY